MKLEQKIKEPIRLRCKKLANGNKSIYLDFYTENYRRYEFLKLYLIPEQNKVDKNSNTETLKLANAIKAQKIVEYQNKAHGFNFNNSKSKMNFIDYLNDHAKKYGEKGSKSFKRSMYNSINYLKKYRGTEITIKDVNKSYLLGFIDFLNKVKARCDKPLSNASKTLYFNIIVIALNKAVKEEIIQKNPTHNIQKEDRPSQKQSTREYLTIEEVKVLTQADCISDTVKYGFLFSCFTGLRYSDIKQLKWSNIQLTGKGQQQLKIIQQKTGEPIYIPLSNNALEQLPIKDNDTDIIFKMPHVSTTEKYLKLWSEKANIKKHVTFHVGRHTYATMLLTYGADIYTVSKLLGHTSVKTTQIYAKIVDEKKIVAVNLIPNINL